ncbi:MAG: hypothetical protein LBE67_12240 [Kocuria palustris]|jgi:hypothetical protein|uniref:hypothetical protein n=1 Tax=Kocuria palustris TaxID=71999 RepID=UPI001E052EA6|nr:hypothetical protein [Kocuria palustris]MBZ6375735.1 hypothetical protein [Kocuria palustris]
MSIQPITQDFDPLTIPAALEARSLVVQRDQASTDEEREALSARIVAHHRSTGWRYWPKAFRSHRGSWTPPGGTVLDRIWDVYVPPTRRKSTTTKEA